MHFPKTYVFEKKREPILEIDSYMVQMKEKSTEKHGFSTPEFIVEGGKLPVMAD